MNRGDLILRIFLPVYFVVYMLAGLTLNLVRARKKYGIDAGRVQKGHPVMELGERWRNVLFAAALVMVALFAIDPPLLSWCVPIPYLETPPVRGVGVALLLASFVVVRTAQSQLGSSWRVGLDLAAPPAALITSGIYARSRNPIYMGMLGTAAGLFLVLPNAVSLAIAALSLLLLQVRVRVEEEYLLKAHGAAFTDYCRRTPRWMLVIGRPPAE